MKIEQVESLNESHNICGNITLVFKTPKNRDNPYIIINRKMSSDKRLNVIEKGILLNILDNNDNYLFRLENEFKNSGIDGYTFDKSIKHLIELNYIVYKKLSETECWIINECSDASYLTNENVENTFKYYMQEYKNDDDVIEKSNYSIICDLIRIYKENDDLIKTSKKEYFKNK